MPDIYSKPVAEIKDFNAFVQFIAQHKINVFCETSIQKFQHAMEHCTEEQFQIISSNVYFVQALIAHLRPNSNLLTKLLHHFFEKKDTQQLKLILARDEALNAQAFIDIVNNQVYADFLIKEFDKDHRVIQKLMYFAYVQRNYELLQRLIHTELTPEVGNYTEALESGQFFLALLALRGKHPDIDQVKKRFPLKEVSNSVSYADFFMQLYGQQSQALPMQSDKEDPYYKQHQKLASSLRAYYDQHYPDKNDNSSSNLNNTLDGLTDYENLCDMQPEQLSALKHYLEIFFYALSTSPIPQDKKIFGLTQFLSLSKEFCFSGRLLNLGALSTSLCVHNNSLTEFIANHRVQTVNSYVEHYIRIKKIDEMRGLYPHIRLYFLRLLKSNGWTLLEEELCNIQDKHTDDLMIDALDSYKFISLFKESNSILSYLIPIISNLLEHAGTYVGRTLALNLFCEYQFNYNEVQQFKKALKTFKLCPIERSDHLFEVIPDPIDEPQTLNADTEVLPLQRINFVELYAALVLELHNQGLLLARPSKNIISLCQYKNTLFGIQLAEGLAYSIEQFPLKEIIGDYNLTTYMQALTDSNSTEIDNYYSLDIAVQEVLHELGYSLNIPMPNKILLDAIKAERLTYLRSFRKFFANMNWLLLNQDSYVTLCKLFIEDKGVLNHLLAAFPQTNYALYEKTYDTLNSCKDQVLSLIEAHFKSDDQFYALVTGINNKSLLDDPLYYFILNFSPSLFQRLTRYAIEKNCPTTLENMLSYVKKECVYFPVLIQKDKELRSYYLQMLQESINNPCYRENGFFDLMVNNWKYFIESENAGELPFIIATEIAENSDEIRVYMELVGNCIEMNLIKALQALLSAKGKIAGKLAYAAPVLLKQSEKFRDQYIYFLDTAIEKNKLDIFIILIGMPLYAGIESSAFSILEQHKPEELKTLFKKWIKKTTHIQHLATFTHLANLKGIYGEIFFDCFEYLIENNNLALITDMLSSYITCPQEKRNTYLEKLLKNQNTICLPVLMGELYPKKFENALNNCIKNKHYHIFKIIMMGFFEEKNGFVFDNYNVPQACFKLLLRAIDEGNDGSLHDVIVSLAMASHTTSTTLLHALTVYDENQFLDHMYKVVADPTPIRIDRFFNLLEALVRHNGLPLDSPAIYHVCLHVLQKAVITQDDHLYELLSIPYRMGQPESILFHIINDFHSKGKYLELGNLCHIINNLLGYTAVIDNPIIKEVCLKLLTEAVTTDNADLYCALAVFFSGPDPSPSLTLKMPQRETERCDALISEYIEGKKYTRLQFFLTLCHWSDNSVLENERFSDRCFSIFVKALRDNEIDLMRTLLVSKETNVPESTLLFHLYIRQSDKFSKLIDVLVMQQEYAPLRRFLHIFFEPNNGRLILNNDAMRAHCMHLFTLATGNPELGKALEIYTQYGPQKLSLYNALSKKTNDYPLQRLSIFGGAGGVAAPDEDDEDPLMKSKTII